MNSLLEFVNSIVKSIVERPKDVKVSLLKTTKNLVIQIESSVEDHGRIIGKGGKTINAIKTLVNAINSSNKSGDKRRINVELIEEEDYLGKIRG